MTILLIAEHDNETLSDQTHKAHDGCQPKLALTCMFWSRAAAVPALPMRLPSWTVPQK